MMHHDSAMDHGAMGQMGNDSMDHGDMMMKHDSAMGANMMFMAGSGHKAAGDYEVTESAGKPQLKLTDDFAVDPAPDTYLVLTKGSEPGGDALFLAKLKRPTGGQVYDLPKGKDLSGYTHLLVWSKKEKRALATAEWHPGSGGAMQHM